MEYVQSYGRKKTALAIAHCKRGHGLMKLNGRPLDTIKPDVLRAKVKEVIIVLGCQYFTEIDVRVRSRGGGNVSQIYAVRQAIAKAVVAFHGKFIDEMCRKTLKDNAMNYDRTLLVTDLRRCEPKRAGGGGARARFQKSYR